MERAVSLRVLAVHLDQKLQYLYTDNTLFDSASDTAVLYSHLPICNASASTSTGYITSLLLSDAADVSVTSGTGRLTSHKCQSVGHALFFADTAKGTLNKIHLLPISTTEVFVPDYAGSGTLGAAYSSLFNVQEQTAPTVNLLSQGITLVQGVDKIQGFALDWRSR